MSVVSRKPALPASPKRRLRWRWRLLLGAITLFGLVWLLPAIVGHTALRNWVAHRLLADLQGSVSLGGASLGWFSPVELRDVEIRDQGGQTFCRIPRVESTRSLIGMLADLSDLGGFRIEQPSFEVVCAGEQTNVEQVFSHWLQSGATSSSRLGLALDIELVNATVRIHDEETKNQWSLEPVNLTLALPRDRTTPTRLELHGTLPNAGQSGKIDLDLTTRLVQAAGNSAGAEGQLSLRMEGLPLAMVAPVLRRLDPTAQLDGIGSGNMDYRWGVEEAGNVHAHGQGHLSARKLTWAGAYLGEDRVHLERLEGEYRFASQGNQFRIDQAEISCDLGKAALAGTVDTSQSLLASITRPSAAVNGHVDLARLAEMLPRTLHLRTDTRITAGVLSADLKSASGPNGVVWTGTVSTSDLHAVRQGQPIAWQQPVTVALTAHQTGDALPVIDQLQCDSGFLKVQASGSLDRWTANADYDLGRLTDQVSQFVDLGAVHVAGHGSTRITLQRGSDGSFRSDVEAQFNQLDVAGSDGRHVQENSLVIQLEATGKTVAAEHHRVDSASLRVQSGRDGIELQLLEPIGDVLHGPWSMFQLHATGDLVQWRRRLQPWASILDGWQTSGLAEMTARLRRAPEGLDFDQFKLQLREFRLQGQPFALSEPAVDIQTTGHWRQAARRLELAETKLACATLSAQSRNLQWVSSANGVPLTGSIVVQGDLAGLQRWVQDAAAIAREPINGQVAGQVDLQPSGTRLSVLADLTLQQLTLGPPAAPNWREPQVHVRSRGHYDPAADLVQIQQLQVDSSALSCDAAGSLAKLAGSKDLSLAGQLSYDLEKLTPLLRPYVGSSVKLVGQDARPFRIEGPLAAPAATQRVAVVVGPSAPATPGLLTSMAGEGALSWKSAEAYGFRFGPAGLSGRLANGSLHMKPIESAVNQGRLRLEPSLRLEPGPVEWQIAKGTVIDRVHITPEMCADALGYALPVLAGVTEIEGQISVASDGGRVPLGAPAQADVAGRFTLHSVRIGLGPLVRELTVLLKEPASANLARESVVPFRVVDGRVYHKNLELVFPELTIRTHGSVGLDGTLALMAEMPVPPKWVGSTRLGQAVAEQTIRLPIGGTLAKPKLDEQALRTASAHFLRDTAGEALRQVLDHQLERLLRPKR